MNVHKFFDFNLMNANKPHINKPNVNNYGILD